MTTPPWTPRACAACGAPADAHARFCMRCGRPLPGAAPSPLAPAGGGGAGGGAGVAVTVVAIVFAVMVGVAILGVLAAIAIPNFLRYQLRSRQAGVHAEVAQLARLEQAHLEEEGDWFDFGGAVPAAARAPGRERLRWSAEELLQAAEVGWEVGPPGSYAVYAFVERPVEDGVAALSICAETDLDGDGRNAAWGVFLAGQDDRGAPVEPLPAPCSEAAVLEHGALPGDEGVVRLSPDGVF